MQWGIAPALLVAVWLAFATPAAEAAVPWTIGDTEQALVGAPAVVACVVWAESSGDPYAVGSRGELGVAQLLPTENGGGQMAEFLEGDWVAVEPPFRSPYDPYLSVLYLEHYLASRGDLRPWTTYRGCV